MTAKKSFTPSPGADHGQRPPTPANPTRQRYQLGVPGGKGK